MTPSVAESIARLDPATERAGRAFVRHIDGVYVVSKAIVYGSRARGDHRADSDVDLAVVLQGCCGDRTKAALEMAGIAVDVLLETGLLVQALPFWASEFEHPESFANPALIHNIEREGLRL